MASVGERMSAALLATEHERPESVKRKHASGGMSEGHKNKKTKKDKTQRKIVEGMPKSKKHQKASTTFEEEGTVHFDAAVVTVVGQQVSDADESFGNRATGTGGTDPEDDGDSSSSEDEFVHDDDGDGEGVRDVGRG